jgi:RNA polymerase sigma-70 factor (ECF subfamily)
LRPPELSLDSPAADAFDAELVRRMTAGESTALGTLFERHGSKVLGLLVRMLGQSGEAEEVLQEVFLHAWTRAATFRADKGTARSWLIVMARSRALDRLRSSKAARRRDETAGAEQVVVVAAEADADLEHQELSGQMRRLMGGLPPEQRQCLELAFFEGLTHSQVSSRLGVPLGTVKSRILMAMRKLKQGLGTYR